MYKFKIGKFSFKIRNFPRRGLFHTLRIKRALKKESRLIVKDYEGTEGEIIKKDFVFKNTKALLDLGRGFIKVDNSCLK
jgi:hypothetical protein